MSTTQSTDLNEYVRENHETLATIIKHGNDDFVRALALAAIVEYGDDPDIEKVRREIDRAAESRGSA